MALRLSKTNFRLAVVGALLIGAIAGTAVWLISERWRVALAESRHADTSLAQVLAEQTSRTIQPVDLTLRELQARLEPGGPLNSGNATGWGTKATFDVLVERRKGLPQVGALVLVDLNGRLVNYSHVFPPPPLDLSIRSYHKHFSTNDDHALFISEPIQILQDGTWTIQLARRINGPHGEFAGVISATVTLTYLEDFYKAVAPESGAVMLLRHDGTVLASYPPSERQPGLNMPAEAPWYRILQDGGGDYRAPGAAGSEARLVTVRPLRDYPLVIDVSTTEAAAFSGWRQQLRWLLLGAVVAAACVVILLRVFAAQLGRLERSEASLVRQNGQLQNGRLQFNAVLENISQGVTFFDGDQRLIVCNRRYLEIYRLSPDEVPTGTSLSDIIGMREACGTFVAMTRAEFLARRAALARPGQPYDVTDVLSDGRTVTMHYQPLPNGGWVTTHEDVTERYHNEASLAFMARHDALTELPNRTLFQERLEQAVGSVRHGGLCALLCLDLDRFKVINDTLGHPVGDGLLRAVSARLSASTRDVDTVARLGGDEFAIVLVDLKSVEHATLLVDRLIEALRQPYDIDGNKIVAATSIGISLAPCDGTSCDTLLKNADIALYVAKTDGRNTYRFFEAKMNAHVQELRLVELDLRDALPANQFELHYQPVLNLRSGRVSGFEALIRWNHPVRGLISPANFIPVAEETGLIVPIGEWVLRTACREAAAWPGDTEIAVNLSAAQFREAHLFDVVQSALAESGLAPNRLELEITESVLLQSSEDRLALLHRLRALGIRIALDDFGTGYSSLSYLHGFPFDKIKIDQSFIRDLNTNKDATVIVGAIINLARNLGMTAVAEGVETAQQLATLRDQGCTLVQGYLFSRPRPASDAPALIRTLRVHQTSDPAFPAAAPLGRLRQVAVT